MTIHLLRVGFPIQSVADAIGGRVRRALPSIASVLLGLTLAACGGGSADAPPPPETVPIVPMVPVVPVPPAALPPTITQHPASLNVTAGQSASFSVAATGTAPLAYQWQRNGMAITGATGTTYALSTTAVTDSAAIFRAVVTNVAGSATSNNATLTVTASVPVLTITPQPASTSVVTGSAATFTVGGTCSSGTLTIQWQRRVNSASTFVDVAGATNATYSFVTAGTDSGVQVLANLACSGQSATSSNIATLTVTAPPTPTSASLALLPIMGLRDLAAIDNASGLDRQNDGSYVLTTRNRIKRISADLLTITPLAGTFDPGTLDGPSAAASFNGPQGVAHDSAGNLYVADTNNQTIRKIAVNGTVSTLAGSAGSTGLVDGSGSAARFNSPNGLVMGPDGDLYVADTINNLIRRVTTAGVVTTYAGSTSGYADGAANVAKFVRPYGMAFAGNGDLYVGDYGNLRVRLVARSGNAAGAVTTIAGNGAAGQVNGVGTAAQIAFPRAMALSAGALYVSDETQLIRRIDLATATVTTFAGATSGGLVVGNDGGPGVAHFYALTGMVASSDGGLLVADGASIRSVSTAGAARAIATSQAAYYASEGIGTLPQIPLALGPAPPALVVEPNQNIVLTDYGTQLVRELRRAEP